MAPVVQSLASGPEVADVFGRFTRRGGPAPGSRQRRKARSGRSTAIAPASRININPSSKSLRLTTNRPESERKKRGRAVPIPPLGQGHGLDAFSFAHTPLPCLPCPNRVNCVFLVNPVPGTHTSEEFLLGLKDQKQKNYFR